MVLWDLLDGTRIRTVRFEAVTFIAELHPTNHLLFVAAVFEGQPVLVDLSTPVAARKVLTSVPKRSDAELEQVSEKQAQADAKQTTTVTVFTPSGDHIIAGTTRGWLNIISTATGQTMYSTKICSGVVVLVRLTATGREMVINAQDRVIRTYKLPVLSDESLDWENLNLEVEYKFQDLVNRLSWNAVAFSNSGEYLIASTYMNHDIYIWERSLGTLVKILEGREELGAVEWHPRKPLIAALGPENGRIYLWSIHTPQRWSALAPDFVEVEENVDYIEHEDEFDIQPLETLHQRRLDREDEEVDVLTIDPGKATGVETNFRMPVVLPAWDGQQGLHESESEEEVVAVGTGQFRRKSPGRDREWLEEEASGDDGKRTNGAKNAKRRRAE